MSDGPEHEAVDATVAFERLSSVIGDDERLAGAIEGLQALGAQGPSSEEMLNSLDVLWNHFVEFSHPTPVDEMPQIALLSSWLSATFRHAHATSILHGAGFTDTAVANARAAMEHAIYLSYIAATGDYEPVLKEFDDSFRSNWHRMIEGVETGGEAAPDVVHQLLADLPPITADPDTRWMRKIEQVCDKFEIGQVVYAHYRLASSLLHPGFGSAAPTLMTAMVSETLPAKEIVDISTSVLPLAVAACVWAGWAADKVFRVDYFGDVVGEIAERAEILPLTLRAST